ncbi:MAG: phosphoglucosamine mutase [Epulopiscium sp.]|nr:phosphoglucosamine mutase [Candidatus Epulonipiscium sp.]
MGRLFGTDGVRGIANKELTCEVAYQLGRAGAYVLTKETQHQPKILVGTDTRRSKDMLEAAFMAGICSIGGHGISLGVIPTPAVAYLTRYYQADAGVVISASHNPVEYNGIKFFNNQGYKLKDELEEEIEDLIFHGFETLPHPIGDAVGVRSVCKTSVADYLDFLKTTIEGNLKGLTIAVDCANGAAYEVAPTLLKELGAKVYSMGAEPDGTNINDHCGSTYLEPLQQFVKATKADIGIAFDGDADRCLAVDEQGDILDGDQILAICGFRMKEKGILNKNTIVSTVMSNIGLSKMGQEQGISIQQCRVGDRYVLETMLKHGYNLGGEQSGHTIFLDKNTTGDGLVTALQLLQVLQEKKKPLSKLKQVIQIYPQVLINVEVSNEKKEKYLEDPMIAGEIHRLEEEFSNEGRVLIRPSGTEPLIRIMLEGQDQKILATAANTLAEMIQEKLG